VISSPYTSMLHFGIGDEFKIVVKESGFELVYLGKCWDHDNQKHWFEINKDLNKDDW